MPNRTIRVAIVVGYEWGKRDSESYERQAENYRQHAENCSDEHVTYEPKIFSGKTASSEAYEWIKNHKGAIVFLSRNALREAERILENLKSERLHTRIRVWVFTGLLLDDRVNVLDIGMYDLDSWKYVAR